MQSISDQTDALSCNRHAVVLDRLWSNPYSASLEDARLGQNDKKRPTAPSPAATVLSRTGLSPLSPHTSGRSLGSLFENPVNRNRKTHSGKPNCGSWRSAWHEIGLQYRTAPPSLLKEGKCCSDSLLDRGSRPACVLKFHAETRVPADNLASQE